MSGGGGGTSPTTSATAGGGSTTSTGGLGGLLAPLAQQLTAQGPSFGGGPFVGPAIPTPWGSTQESKADYYNQQLGKGLTDTQIRANVEANQYGGPQSNSDWSYLVQQAGMRSPTGRPLAGSGQFYQPVYQPEYQNYNTGNAMGVSQYGQMPDMFSMQTPFNFGGQMMGGGYGMYGMNNPFSPYSNTFLNMPSSMQGATMQQKADVYRDAMSRGFNDQQMRNQATGLYGQQSNRDWGYLQGAAMGMTPGLGQGTMQNKADFYNQALGQGYTDSAVRNAANQMFGQQTQADWNALQRASGPAQPIVSRSAGMRGTPNVIRRAEGGIASLVGDE